MGRFAVGNPIKGFPAGCSPAPSSHQTITAPARRNGKRFDSLTRFFALENEELCHAAIPAKLRPRGHPRAACGPPFLLFGLRPRRNGVGFRPLRRARRALPSTCQPFEKGWTENLVFEVGQVVRFWFFSTSASDPSVSSLPALSYSPAGLWQWQNPRRRLHP